MPSFVQLNATPMPRAARTSPGVTNPLTAQAKATVQYCQQSSFKGSFPSSAQGQVTLREFTTSGDAAYVSSGVPDRPEARHHLRLSVGDGKQVV